MTTEEKSGGTRIELVNPDLGLDVFVEKEFLSRAERVRCLNTQVRPVFRVNTFRSGMEINVRRPVGQIFVGESRAWCPINQSLRCIKTS